MRTKCWAVAGVIVVLALCASVSAWAQGVDVLQRVRLGGYAEDVTYVSHGPLARHIVFVDGYEVWGVPGQAHGRPKARKLFDLRALGIGVVPNGIAYVASRRLFYVNDASQTSRLFLVDHQGRPRGIREIRRLGGYRPWYAEAIGYIPPEAGSYGDHLVMVARDSPSSGSRLEFIELDGQVVREVVPQCPGEPDATRLLGVAYVPGDRLLLSFHTTESLCTVDFDGVPVGPGTQVEGVHIGEGVVRLDDGRIVVLAYPERLLFFDAELTRRPEDDRNDVVGLGLMMPAGVGWDSDGRRFLVVNGGGESAGSGTTQVSAVPSSLDRATRVIDLTVGPYPGTRGPAYISGERLIVVAHGWQPFRGLLVYEAGGTLKDALDLAPRRPSSVAYIPGTDFGAGEFVVRYPGEPAVLYFLDRHGATLRSLDLSLQSTANLASVYGFTYFSRGSPDGGRLLVLGIRDPSRPFDVRAVVTDPDGTAVGEFDPEPTLGLLYPTAVAAITTGSLAGAFAMLDHSAGELVIFRLN